MIRKADKVLPSTPNLIFMRMSSPSRLLPGLALIFSIQFAQAAVIIDNFTDAADPSGTTTVEVSAAKPTPNPATFTGTGLTGVLGLERRITVERTFQTGTGARSVIATVSDAPPAYLEYRSSGGANGFVQLAYGATNPLNADLSGESMFRLIFEGYDAPNSNPLVTTLSLTSGTGSGTLVRNLPGVPLSAGGILDFNFNDPAFSAVDFSDVDSITIKFDPNQGGDFDVTSITAIPEPSGAITVLFGLLAAGFVRRR